MPTPTTDPHPTPPAPTRRFVPSEIGLGTLWKSLRDAVVLVDPDAGEILLWNAAAERIFGWPADEEGALPWGALVMEDAQARFLTLVDGHPGRPDDAIETRVRRRDAPPVDVELTIEHLSHQADRRIVLARARVITERVALREALDKERRSLLETNETLLRAVEALEAFTRVVSHDLKEPARAVEAFLDEFEERHGGALTADGRALLDRAHAASRHLRNLLAELLGDAVAFRGDVPARPLDVEETLRAEACAIQYRPLLEARKARLRTAAMPPVLATPTTLCHVLTNLVMNAVKHNPAPDPDVSVYGIARDDVVEIVVEDNGPGFPADVLRAFAERRSTPSSDPLGGLGLALVRRTVERLGGRMWLDASPLGGGAVHVTLPAAR